MTLRVFEAYAGKTVKIEGRQVGALILDASPPIDESARRVRTRAGAQLLSIQKTIDAHREALLRLRESSTCGPATDL
jgi:hypothetical protein